MWTVAGRAADCGRAADWSIMVGVWDVAIIGGGIVGTATGMALVRRGGVRVVVLEAEPALAAHQTGHNSGVIHSGLYYKPGSLKASNSVEGRRAMYRFCEEHAIPHDRCGKLVVATEPSEIPALDELERRGRANRLEGLRRLRGEELQDYEPAVRGIAGLHVPETGIVDYAACHEGLRRDRHGLGRRSADRGASVRRGAPARKPRSRDDGRRGGRRERSSTAPACSRTGWHGCAAPTPV